MSFIPALQKIKDILETDPDEGNAIGVFIPEGHDFALATERIGARDHPLFHASRTNWFVFRYPHALRVLRRRFAPKGVDEEIATNNRAAANFRDCSASAE